MSHVLNYDGRYFRIEIGEVVSAEQPDKKHYVAWCSDGVKELRELPKQALSRTVAGPPLPTFAEALRHAQNWIKTNWDSEQARRSPRTDELAKVMYTVWLFQGDSSSGFEFREFAEAKSFARAAEKGAEITKVGITNRESPQYLTVWEKAT